MQANVSKSTQDGGKCLQIGNIPSEAGKLAALKYLHYEMNRKDCISSHPFSSHPLLLGSSKSGADN
jgi:hypothetical protein